MDELANKAEQLSISQQLLGIFDNCHDDGTLTAEQTDEVVHLANRLAELVEALADRQGWKYLPKSLPNR